MGSVDLATTDPVLIGLCVSSHNESALCTAELRNVALDGTGITGDWQSLDIGTGRPGSTTELGSNNAFTIRASGSDIWNQNDEGHFVYQALRGDGTLTARITNLTRTDGWAKAGVMFRESLADNSKFAHMLLSSDNGLSFQRRITTGASAIHTAGPSGTYPQWVRLVRAGNTIAGYASTDGQTWTLVGQGTVEMGVDIFVGLAATSHNDGYLEVAEKPPRLLAHDLLSFRRVHLCA
jgi:regulation of enolase protein 1 (concanavalin A-like superfamily)